MQAEAAAVPVLVAVPVADSTGQHTTRAAEVFRNGPDRLDPKSARSIGALKISGPAPEGQDGGAGAGQGRLDRRNAKGVGEGGPRKLNARFYPRWSKQREQRRTGVS